ncbi:MAG: RluA family pseudouridine synthase [Erysipelotrichaceae bacterium]|nr:RluA family pseudouridine synthase [Erysipelotrichaceae bacterium]
MNGCLRVTVNEEISSDELLLRQFCLSRRNLHLGKQEGRFVLNGSVIRRDTPLHKGDELLFYYQKEEDISYKPVPFDLKILYEDDLILVVDKPAGYIIHSDGTEDSRRDPPVTVNNFVAYYYQLTGQKHRVYNLHRLDMETSGCLLYCKESYLVSYFSHAIENKEVVRRYLALIEGVIRRDRMIDRPIGRDRHVSNRFRISPTGKKAVTEVRVLKHDDTHTLVECTLQTGRTHQIRVHLASIGHPIVGDTFYGAKENKRLMLHSHQVEFFSPLVLKTVKVTCPPEDGFSL